MQDDTLALLDESADIYRARDRKCSFVLVCWRLRMEHVANLIFKPCYKKPQSMVRREEISSYLSYIICVV